MAQVIQSDLAFLFMDTTYLNLTVWSNVEGTKANDFVCRQKVTEVCDQKHTCVSRCASEQFFKERVKDDKKNLYNWIQFPLNTRV